MSLVVAQNPIKETLTPDPDGVTVVFNTSQAYKAESIVVWLNGVKLIAGWDDGYTETSSTEITMKEAPLTGDSVQAEYEPL